MGSEEGLCEYRQSADLGSLLQQEGGGCFGGICRAEISCIYGVVVFFFGWKEGMFFPNHFGLVSAHHYDASLLGLSLPFFAFAEEVENEQKEMASTWAPHRRDRAEYHKYHDTLGSNLDNMPVKELKKVLTPFVLHRDREAINAITKRIHSEEKWKKLWKRDGVGTEG